MKYLLLVLMLAGCSNVDQVERIKKEATAFCSCHGGVDGLAFSKYSYSLMCKDGFEIKGQGDMENQHIYSDCK